MKVAFVSAAREGPDLVARAARPLLRALPASIELTYFRDCGTELSIAERPVAELRAADFDQIVYTVADDASARFIVPLVRALGGTVWLFDWRLGALAAAAYPELDQPGFGGHLRALKEGGLRDARRRLRGAPLGELHLNRSIVRTADAFLVHSAWMRARILEERNAWTPIGVLPHALPGASSDLASEVPHAPELPEQWADGTLVVVGSTGADARALLAAFARARAGDPGLRLLLITHDTPEVREAATEMELSDWVRVQAPAAQDTVALARAARVWIHAGDPDRGASWHGLHTALGLGTPVLTIGLGAEELPNSSVVRVGAGDHERLALELERLTREEGAREQLRSAGRTYAASTCDPDTLARFVAERLATFPPHHAKKKSIIRSAIEAADEARAARDAGVS